MSDNEPLLLLEQSKRILAVENILDGLKKEYLTALVQGRLDYWAKAAHSLIDLVAADSHIPRTKRNDMDKS